MPGMKRDCGGAAAILGAFKATVKQVSEILHITEDSWYYLSMVKLSGNNEIYLFIFRVS